MSNEKLSNEVQTTPLRKTARILLICLSISFGWYTGQIIAFGFITLLQKLGLDDNLFSFLDAVLLF